MKLKKIFNYRNFHHRSVYLKLFLLIIFLFFSVVIIFSLAGTSDATKGRVLRYETAADFIISNIGGLLAALLLGLLLIIAVKRVLFSRKLQGPLGNLQDEIRRVTSGNFTPISSAGDPVPLSEEFDQMTAAIENKFRQLQLIQEELQRVLFDLEKMRVDSRLGRSYLEERIKALQNQLHSLDELVAPLELSERKPIPRLLIIGSGGREDAIALQAAHAPSVQTVYAIPGNPGMVRYAECINLPVKPPFTPVIKFALQHNIDLVFIGPEQPLAAGLADQLRDAGVAVFGPGSAGALLEASKLYAKKLMKKYRIPTAEYAAFTAGKNPQAAVKAAVAHLQQTAPPWVIKADGLAAGKGVTVTGDITVAEKTIRGMLNGELFGDAGKTILIEEYLHGEEISLQLIADNNTMLPLLPAQDYKPLHDNNEGPNTGGMGAYAPTPLYTPRLDKVVYRKIVKRVQRLLHRQKIDYRGVIYFSLKLTETGPKVVEINCRLGDPEAQVVLPLLRNDLFELASAAAENRLAGMNTRFHRRFAVCVILASAGYPEEAQAGKEITGLEKIPGDLIVYHSGTRREVDGTLRTAGGRVLGITAIQQTLSAAVSRAYEGLKQVSFDGKQFRRDIGGQGMVQERLAETPAPKRRFPGSAL